jgi:acid phosphatase
MTTHLPRKAYTTEELAELYPKELELQLVQVVSHHVLPEMANRRNKGY